jgi:hypothetical protein
MNYSDFVNNSYGEDLLKITEAYPPLDYVLVDEDVGPEGVLAAYNAGKPIPVWKGDSENTIWGAPELNWLFRAHHDSIHLLCNIPFTLQGEFLVSEVHSALAERLGLYKYARAARCDVAGFACYQHENGGEFAPQNLTLELLMTIKTRAGIMNYIPGIRIPGSWELKSSNTVD